jgi:methionyl-tRNA formyltransferase
MHLGSETVISFRAHRNVITTIQKDASEIKSFKLNKENCKIDWTKSALLLIRGLSTAWCILSDKTEEWTVKTMLKDHGLTTGMLICTKKNENRSRKVQFAVSW